MFNLFREFPLDENSELFAYQTIDDTQNEFNNKDEATLYCQNKSEYLKFSKSYITFRVRIRNNNNTNIAANEMVTFVNNIGVNAFKQLELYGNNKKIEDKEINGIRSLVDKLITYSDDYSKSTATSEFWFPDTSDQQEINKYNLTYAAGPPISVTAAKNANYNKGFHQRWIETRQSRYVWISVKLSDLFEFFKRETIFIGIEFRIVLTKNSVNNMIITTNDNGEYKIEFDRLSWRIPKYKPNDMAKDKLLSILSKSKALKYEWEETKIEFHHLVQQRSVKFDIIGITRKPKYLYLVFQSIATLNSKTANNMIFNHFNVESITVKVDDQDFPPIECNFTANDLNISQVYQNFLEAGCKDLDVDTGTVVSKRHFASLYPIFCFNLDINKNQSFEKLTNYLIKVSVNFSQNPAEAFQVYAMYKYDNELNINIENGQMFIAN